MITVSRAVSGAGRVNPGVLERVVAVCEKRRYWSNAVARSLRVGVTWVLGISNEIYPFFIAVARALEGLGAAPARMLLEMVEARRSPRSVVPETELIIRGSCGGAGGTA